mgnify:CR=1 FL=1
MTTASEINSRVDAGCPGRRARYDGRSEARPLRSLDVGRAFGALYRTETMRARLPAILTRGMRDPLTKNVLVPLAEVGFAEDPR